MKRCEQNRLLREIFADENVEHLREASLARGLAALRSRRRRRIAIASGAASIAVVAALLAAFHRRAAPPIIPASFAPAAVSHIKMINDDELLALFPNRSVALIGEPGQQQLVFLDAPSRAGSPSQNE